MTPTDPPHLQQRAEAIYRAHRHQEHGDLRVSAEDLLYELEVHQIELEMQNEELQQAQLHLETALARFEDLFNLAPVGYLTLWGDGTVRNANLMAATLFGVERRDLARDNLTRRVVPPHKEALLQHLAATFRETGHQVCELKLRRGDGRTFFAQLHSVAQPVGDAREAQCLTVVTDITERWRAEEENRKLSQAIAQSPDSVMVTDPQGRIEYVNGAFERNTGYRRTEVLGKDPGILRSDETPRETYAAMEAAISQERPWAGEIVSRRKDGTRFIELAHIAPVCAADGAVTHYVAVNEDITEKKRLAEALERNRRELEQQVTARTVELCEAKEQAEAANIAKSAFLANVSHELRTPLNTIVLLSKLLADDGTDLGPEETGHARVIQQAGRDMQHLIEGLLEHSRAEAGMTPLHLESTDTRVLVQQLVELFRPQFDQQGLYLRLTVASGIPLRVRTDHDKLGRILKNFLGNAVKFTSRGGVDILMESPGRADCALCIRVHDTGIGIPGDKHGLIFEAFRQADGSTGRRYGGSGLGLSICRRLAQHLGGLIELESTPGQGSTFSLLLPADPGCPLAKPLPQSRKSEAPAQGFASVQHRGLAGHSVLLVERDLDTLLELIPVLEEMGIRVIAAADQEEVVECLSEEEHFSLVLVDVGLSGQEGYAAIRRIRAEGRCSRLPIIAIAQGSDAGREAECLAAGVSAVLPRPLDTGRLERVLAQHLLQFETNRQ